MRTALIVLGTTALCSTLGVAQSSQTIGVDVSIPDPHHHVVPVHQLPWKRELAPDAHIVEVDRGGEAGGQEATATDDGRLRAFTFNKPGAGDRIFFEPVRAGPRFEIQGLPLPHRPFSNLAWIGGHYLVFDRWSSPHYGIHYVVDAERKELLLVVPFPDEFYLEQQRPGTEQQRGADGHGRAIEPRAAEK